MGTKPEKLRIGVIGAGGGITYGHLKSLLEKPEVEFAALNEPSKENLERMRKRVPEIAKLPDFADYRQMLDEVKLDGVVICSPHTAHFQQIMDSLDRGLHVLTEKPMVCCVADALKVIEKAKQKKKTVVVAYQRRFQGNYRCLREFVRAPAFGTPTYLQAYQSQRWHKAVANTWRTDPKLSGGGQINDSGSHLVDMLFWLMPSRPVEVCAMMDNRGTKVDVDSTVAFRFADGCLGSLAVNGSGAARPGWREDISITGDNERQVLLRNGQVMFGNGKEFMEVKQFGPDINRAHHWIDVILGKTENQSPPEEFLPTIAFTEACWKSAAEGGRLVKVQYK